MCLVVPPALGESFGGQVNKRVGTTRMGIALSATMWECAKRTTRRGAPKAASRSAGFAAPTSGRRSACSAAGALARLFGATSPGSRRECSQTGRTLAGGWGLWRRRRLRSCGSCAASSRRQRAPRAPLCLRSARPRQRGEVARRGRRAIAGVRVRGPAPPSSCASGSTRTPCSAGWLEGAGAGQCHGWRPAARRATLLSRRVIGPKPILGFLRLRAVRPLGTSLSTWR